MIKDSEQAIIRILSERDGRCSYNEVDRNFKDELRAISESACCIDQIAGQCGFGSSTALFAAFKEIRLVKGPANEMFVEMLNPPKPKPKPVVIVEKKCADEDKENRANDDNTRKITRNEAGSTFIEVSNRPKAEPVKVAADQSKSNRVS